MRYINRHYLSIYLIVSNCKSESLSYSSLTYGCGVHLSRVLKPALSFTPSVPHTVTLARQGVYAMARIRRANEGRTRDSVRRDAWRCVSGEAVRAMLWRKF